MTTCTYAIKKIKKIKVSDLQYSSIGRKTRTISMQRGNFRLSDIMIFCLIKRYQLMGVIADNRMHVLKAIMLSV